MKTRVLYRQLLAMTLAASGWVPLALPVLAAGTAAGQSISNTATATYEDPNAPGTTIDTTSNTVVVTVAEVAGVTVTASGITDVNGGSIGVGDVLNYDYTVTNVGNDPTRFRIPNLATVTGPGSVTGNLQTSTDGGATWTPITTPDLITGSVAPGGSILVRVPVTVAAGAVANNLINVTLGETPGDAQNQLRNPNGGDVYTVDNPDGTGSPEVDGAPVNGVREASMTQNVTVASTLKNYALATLLKTRSAYSNAGTPAINDDTLTYNLSLRVETNDPTGNSITPAPLVGSTITMSTGPETRILVSDAIPAGTDLAVVPSAPPGWQAVYTTDPITTNANAATWTRFITSTPTLSAVTRVGFINTDTVTSVSPGSTVTGFSVQVAVESSATAPLTVANIAQVFGQTSGTNAPVYDESGDQNPSNYDGPTPPIGTDTNSDGVPDTAPTVEDGYINDPTDLTNTGTDTGNNNTGSSSPAGEANVFIVAAPVPSALQNGPENEPDAIGPTDNNDDFTNKSSLVPPNTAPGSTLDPSPVAFTNTVTNAGTAPGTLTLLPTPPATATDLPDGTTVTVTYGADSVSYSYTSGGGFVLVPGGNTTAGTPITVPNLAAGQTVNYGVEVNLPLGTQLSTDIDRGFPVPITAAIDTNGTPGAEATNITIDRVYTGFLKMVKQSRVLPGTGPAPAAADTTFSANPKSPAPGNIIEYRITYSNISEPDAGIGNVLLNASNVSINEDGVTLPNNWALDNDSDGRIDTSNIVGSASDSGPSTITFFSGNPATTSGSDQTGTTVTADVTRYVNTVPGLVAPGDAREFTFQRRVN